MLDKIFVWLRKYNLEITWFLIGFLFLAGLQELREGNIVIGLIYFGFAAGNYLLRPHK